MKKLPRKNAKQIDVSMQPTGKWIGRISQSERAFLQSYVKRYLFLNNTCYTLLFFFSFCSAKYPKRHRDNCNGGSLII